MDLPALDRDVVFSNHDKFFPLPQDEAGEFLIFLRAVSQDWEDGRRVCEGGFHRNEERHDPTRELRVGRVHQNWGRPTLAVIRGIPALNRRCLPLTQFCLKRHCRKSPDQQPMSLASNRSDPSGRVHAHSLGCELEAQLHPMFGCPFQVIHHEPVSRLSKKHPTPVNHRIGKGAIGDVLGIR